MGLARQRSGTGRQGQPQTANVRRPCEPPAALCAARVRRSCDCVHRHARLPAFMAKLVSRRSRPGTRETLSPPTVDHVWPALRAVMRHAVQHNAISANQCEALGKPHGVGDRSGFEHNPLTAPQVADICTGISAGPPSHSVYGLMVEFLTYSGPRASECAGREIRDIVFASG